MKSSLRLSCAVAALIVGLGQNASADLISPNGQFGFSNRGAITLRDSGNAITSDLFSAATATFANLKIISLAENYSGSPNDFCNSAFDCLHDGPAPLYVDDYISRWNGTSYVLPWSLDLTFATLPQIEFSVTNGVSNGSTPANRFVWTANSYTASQTTVGLAKFTNIYFLGTFVDNGGTFSSTANNASMSLTISTNNNSNPSLAGTFATPPEANTLTPEPGTWMLFSSALAGVVVIRRRRCKNA